MKIINQRLISTVFVFLFTILLTQAFATQTNTAGLTDVTADKRSTAIAQVSNETTTSQAMFLVQESTFHRFIERGKGHLSSIGQRIKFVFAKYDEIPAQLFKAVDQLTGGRGAGYLVKMILLFLLLIASGAGAEKLFNIAIKSTSSSCKAPFPAPFCS